MMEWTSWKNLPILQIDTRNLESVALVLLSKLVPQLDRLYTPLYVTFAQQQEKPVLTHHITIGTNTETVSSCGVLEIMMALSNIGEQVSQAQPGTPPINMKGYLGKRKHGKDQVARWVAFCNTQLYPAVLRMLDGGAATVIQTKSKVKMVSRTSSSKEIVDYRVMNFPAELLRLDDALGKRGSVSCCGPTMKNSVNQCCQTVADVFAFICTGMFFGGMESEHRQLLPISLPHTLKFFVKMFTEPRLANAWVDLEQECPLLSGFLATGNAISEIYNIEINNPTSLPDPVLSHSNTTPLHGSGTDAKRPRLLEPQPEVQWTSESVASGTNLVSSLSPTSHAGFETLIAKYGPPSTVKQTTTLPSMINIRGQERLESTPKEEHYTGPLTNAAKLLQDLRSSLPTSVTIQNLPAGNKESEIILRSSATGMSMDRSDVALHVLGYDVIWNALPQSLDPFTSAQSDVSNKFAQMHRLQLVNLLVLVQSNFRPQSNDHVSTTGNDQIPVIRSDQVVVEFSTNQCSTVGVGLFLGFFMREVNFVVVVQDANKRARMKEKAENLGLANVTVSDVVPQTFALGVALHSCGSATDTILDHCVRRRASFVVVPCCYSQVLSSSSTSSDGVQIPQSERYRNCPLDRSRYATLATEADVLGYKYGECKTSEYRAGDAITSLTADPSIVQECMSYINDDRNARAEERDYSTCLVRLFPERCSQRNQGIVGFPNEFFGS